MARPVIPGLSVRTEPGNQDVFKSTFWIRGSASRPRNDDSFTALAADDRISEREKSVLFLKTNA